jgi:tetratricopeptide (TPR) repeat protein
MRSILASLGEWLMSYRSERFRLFRTARLQHEAYMKQHGINVETITPEQRKHAANSEELKEAENLYRKSLEITCAEGATKNVAIVHQQLGLLHYMRGELDHSRESYSESLSLIQNQPRMDAGDCDAVSTCQIFLGLIALENGDRSLAREHILKAMEIDEALNNPWSIQMDQRLLTRCDNHVQ